MRFSIKIPKLNAKQPMLGLRQTPNLNVKQPMLGLQQIPNQIKNYPCWVSKIFAKSKCESTRVEPPTNKPNNELSP